MENELLFKIFIGKKDQNKIISVGMNLIVAYGFWLDWKDHRKSN